MSQADNVLSFPAGGRATGKSAPMSDPDKACAPRFDPANPDHVAAWQALWDMGQRALQGGVA